MYSQYSAEGSARIGRCAVHLHIILTIHMHQMLTNDCGCVVGVGVHE